MQARTMAWLALALLMTMAASSAVAGWEPEKLSGEDTLDFLTVGPKEGEHWSTVWLVVLDGNLYIRLGERAAGRIQKNTTAPYVAVRIAGEEFPRLRAEQAPEMAERVAAAMGKKYWLDKLMRHFHHPLTMRLVVDQK